MAAPNGGRLTTDRPRPSVVQRSTTWRAILGAAGQGLVSAATRADYTEAAGKPVSYKDLSADVYAEALAGAGLPEPVARALADADVAIARGWLHTTTGDLARLIGRPATPWQDAVRAAVRDAVSGS